MPYINEARGGEGCTQIMYSRSRMTIDPRIPTMPGRSTSGWMGGEDFKSQCKQPNQAQAESEGGRGGWKIVGLET